LEGTIFTPEAAEAVLGRPVEPDHLVFCTG
jgi:hypothetical protein